jgi:hypothetical protein
MQHLDLTDEESSALAQELHDIVETDRYPFSADPHAADDPRQAPAGTGARAAAAPKAYAPPRATVARRRRAGR